MQKKNKDNLKINISVKNKILLRKFNKNKLVQLILI